jgi:hypothetical protein
MGYWNFEGEKSILGIFLNFSQLLVLKFFIYLSIFNLRTIQTLWKTPMSLPFVKMFYSYLIFNSKNCSTLFQNLIIYALN